MVALRQQRLLPVLIAVVGLVVTALLGTWTQRDADRSVRHDFERQAEKDVQRLQREIDRYRDGAAAVRSFVASSPVFDPAEFEAFIGVLETQSRYRGVESALWVTRVAPSELDTFLAAQRERFPSFELRPAGDRDEYRIVTYAAPLAANGPALGFDISTNTPAVAAQDRARDTGKGAATRPVPLAHATGEKGFVVLAPVYHGAAVPADAVQRQALLRGWVATPVRANVLLNETFPVDAPCSIEVFIGSLEPDSLVAARYRPDAGFGRAPTHVAEVETLGQRWFIRVTGAPPPTGLAQATWLVLLAGLVSTALLVLVAHGLIQRNGRKALRASDSLLRSVTGSLHEGLVVIREGAGVVAANPSAPAVLGIRTSSPVQAMSAVFEEALFIRGPETLSLAALARRSVEAAESVEGDHPARASGVLTCIYTPEGHQRWVRVAVRPIEQPAAGGDRHVVVTLTGVTEQMRAENRLRYQAQHDTLTGLANRARFLERLGQLLDAGDIGRPVAVVYIDLDGVKSVNDTCGHPAGDHLLRAVGQRIRSSAPPGHLAARLGGDEFALVGYVASAAEIEETANQLIASLGAPVSVGPHRLQIAASAGIALRRDGSTAENILAEADAAMYKSKELGGGRVTLFDDELRKANVLLVKRIDALRNGLRDEDVFCVFQPILDLATDEVRTVEALVRWRSDDRAILPPMEFLPIVGRVGLGHRVTTLVLQEAAQFQRNVGVRSGIERIWVNLSGSDLCQPGMIDDILAVIAGMDADPWQFGIEVTEHERIPNLRLAGNALEELRRVGMAAALDDFGTGHSYIQLLSELPVDAIKLDKSLVQLLPRFREQAIASALVDMAHCLSLTVTAEGVETPGQLAAVKAIGCDRAQGYLIDRLDSSTAAARDRATSEVEPMPMVLRAPSVP